MELYPYQKKAINFALAYKSTYMMIDLGLGKTAVALKTIEYVKKPALVLCPIKVGYNTWPAEIKNWTPKLTYTIFHGPKKEEKLKWNTDIYILPYSSLKWFYTRCNEHKFKLRKFFTVFDESTFIKAWSTDRFKLYIKNMMPIFSDYRMCLSATPVPNGLIDLWTQFFALDGGKILGKYPTVFRDRFFHYSGAPKYKTWIRSGSQNQIYSRIAPITKRLDRKDYLKLPPITYNPIVIKHTPAILKLYKKFKKDSIFEWEDGMSATAYSTAASSNKLRQFAQGAMYLDDTHGDYRQIHKIKPEALKEVVEGLNGQPCIIPIQFRFDYSIICSVFRQQLPIIRGGTTEKQATILINKWNEGRIPVLLCHPQSISHGVNLQHGGHNIIWYALPWSLDHFTQLNGRLDRIGQKNRVVVNVLMMDLPIETHVFKVLRSKNATQRDLLDTIRKVG